MSEIKFTKEQIEFIKEEWRNSTLGFAPDFLDSLLKPETKKIYVEVEYPETLTKELIINSFNSKIKVTELPEVFTREDIYGVFKAYTTTQIDDKLNLALSERSKK